MNQTKRIIDYLKMETNYAILLTGEYGIGKTHYIIHELMPEIEKVALPKDENKKFKPVHISLFGLKDINEIYSAIFLALYPLLNNRSIKIGIGVLKAFLRGAVQFKGLGDIDKYFEDINLKPKDFTKYDEIVICFDDLDRKSKNLDLSEVFGLVNSMVENEGTKIIIVANEIDDVKKEDTYNAIKEKVIGSEIKFSANVDQVFDNIINERYKAGHSLYFNLIGKHKQLILNSLRHRHNNLRSLIFFFEHFKIIFGIVEMHFQQEKETTGKEQKHIEILYFTLVICLEYKSQWLNEQAIEAIKGYSKKYFSEWEQKLWNSLPARSVKTKIEESTKSFDIELFVNNYYPEKKCFFFQSVVNFITGKSSFDIAMFKSEMETLFPLDKQLTKQEVLLSKLDYNEFFKLSDGDYKILSEEMLDIVDEGGFELTQYPLIFDLATRLDNILQYDLSDLKERFKKGITKGKSHYTYPNRIRFPDHNNPNSEIKEIVAYCQTLDDELHALSRKKEIDDAFKCMECNFDEFLDRLYNELTLTQKPIWFLFPFEETVSVIKSLTAQQLWELHYHFGGRYEKIISSDLIEEKQFILKLKEHLTTTTSNIEENTLRRAAFTQLIDSLNKALQNFPKE